MLSVAHDRGRAAFLTQLGAATDFLGTLGDAELLAPSRCLGWTVGDVVVHVQLGLQEMFHGLVSATDSDPDRDAASYWQTQPPAAELGDDQFAHIRYVRTLFSALRRPTSLLDQWHDTAAALGRGVGDLAPGVLDFQSYRLTTGDFLASWAVEVAVHHLDLHPDGSPLPTPEPAPDALRLARQTVEALLGEALPQPWTDERVVLLGTGRTQPSSAECEHLGNLAAKLPVLG